MALERGMSRLTLVFSLEAPFATRLRAALLGPYHASRTQLWCASKLYGSIDVTHAL